MFKAFLTYHFLTVYSSPKSTPGNYFVDPTFMSEGEDDENGRQNAQNCASRSEAAGGYSQLNSSEL